MEQTETMRLAGSHTHFMIRFDQNIEAGSHENFVLLHHDTTVYST
jgi:hypothetical protein